jgi:hypothetical protein
MNKLVTTTILALTIYQVTAQSTVDNKVLSIKNLYFPTDTISTKDKYSLTVDIKWMDSVIQIRKTTAIRYDLEESRETQHITPRQTTL